MSSSKNPIQDFGLVIYAADRFALRRMPIGAFVSHPAFGRGIVAAADGLHREVDFETITKKYADELKPDEWPDDESPETLMSVSWIEIDRKTVALSELVELQRRPPDKHLRWCNE